MKSRTAIRTLLLLLLSAAYAFVAGAEPSFRLVYQKTVDDRLSAISYAEYEGGGKIVSVMTVNPLTATFKVVYGNPPKSISRFHNENSRALLTVNGGYWDQNYQPTDLCVASGRLIKPVNTLNRHFGLFAVRRSGEVVIADLQGNPLTAADIDDFDHALKSGPYLVRNGKPVALNSLTSHIRTVLARDDTGNVLFIVNRAGTMTYSEMTAFLLHAGLGVIEAFNLDGGSSSGFALDRGSGMIIKESRPIANVIQVEKN